ncbi:PMCA-type calcium-translocating P-type ATPase [Spinellus fusiger]|nr:PMCA-type calcium-translocating P-type ATPase [Spinellus fusiger]
MRHAHSSDNTTLAPSYTITGTHNSVKHRNSTNTFVPHKDPNNPFDFTPEQLSLLVDPKNIKLLSNFGGLEGLAKGLHVDPIFGLKIDQTTVDSNPTTDDQLTAMEVSVSTSRIQNQPNFSKVRFEQRQNVFGTNILPSLPCKSILSLMWDALQDKTLILLSIAAIVSLGVGIYEDIKIPEYDAFHHKIPGVKWVEGVAIIIAILIVVIIGSVNDYQKEKQFQKLNAKKQDRYVKATRNGVPVLISVYDVQVGEVLYLEPGDIVAADGVFIKGNLKCDESAATGESDTVKKQEWSTCERLWLEQKEKLNKEPIHPSSTSYSSVSMSLDTMDPFIISGSKIIDGNGTYIVTAVGAHSYYGRTMMALRSEPQTTPLQMKLNRLADMIANLGSAAGLLMLTVLLIRYFVGWKDGVPDQATVIISEIMKILIVVVTVVVVAVPEGLPLTVTLALAYATQRMMKDNNLVRVLAACETMGNATTVCSDKTGTLTQNKMTAVECLLGPSLHFSHKSERATYALSMSHMASTVPPPVMSLLHQSIAVNSSAFESTKDDKTFFVGNKTESALLMLGRETCSAPYDILRTEWPAYHSFPFSSDLKAMATVIRMPHPSYPSKSIYRAHIKGASETLLSWCSTTVCLDSFSTTSSASVPSSPSSSSSFSSIPSTPTPSASNVVYSRPMTPEDYRNIQTTLQTYTTSGLRTISIGYCDFETWPPPSHETVSSASTSASTNEVTFKDLTHNNGITFVGIVGIQDPLRPGVTEAIKTCQKAGVVVRMVTGDNIDTAKSIAKECGIYTPDGIAMEGPEFSALSSSEKKALLPRLQVLARSSPHDKQVLVCQLKELGEIVAVTGDGTNDGPALKAADVGFSMGIAGTEVAKEASSIILMDDNFSSIVKAILWGRCVNDAVKKFLEFQLTVNITAVILTFVSAVASSSQKSVLTAVQLLWVNLIMDTFAALALATDPPTPQLLERAPEARSAPLITLTMWKMIIGQALFQIAVMLALLYGGLFSGVLQEDMLQTFVFNAFVFCQIFNELNCRRIDNRFNIFDNISKNKFFIAIFILCVVGQCLIVEFGGAAFQVTPMDGLHWAIAVGIGLLSLPVGVLIRCVPDSLFRSMDPTDPSQQKHEL